MSHDPTAYDLGGDKSITDPRIRRVSGYANFGQVQAEQPRHGCGVVAEVHPHAPVEVAAGGGRPPSPGCSHRTRR